MEIELTANTLEVLKNFATINGNILLQPGKLLATTTEAHNIYAYADIEEEIPVKFGIYDLHNFLAVLSSFDKPTLTFSEEVGADGTAKFVMIRDKSGRGEFKYFGSHERLLTYTDKRFKMPPVTASLSLSKGDFGRAMKAAQVGQLEHFVIRAVDDKIEVSVCDYGNQSSNEFKLTADGENQSQENFTAILLNQFLQMMSGAYKISVGGKLVVEFQHSDRPITYYIALEKISKFGGQ